MNELHLFAGIGGGILGGMLLGHRTIGAVEIDPYCRRVLEARQRDGILPPFPIHDDIRTFDPAPFRGRTDVVAGGFPCQDISVAGKGRGLDGERSGLWWEMLRVVREVEPRYVFVENPAVLTQRGLDRILGALAELGFDAEWCVLSAAACGAPHIRKRLWLLAAHPDPDRRRREGERLEEPAGQQGAPRRLADRLRALGEQQHPAPVADAGRARLPAPEREELRGAGRRHEGRAAAERGWWTSEPRVGRVAHGVPSRVDRLRALGNAQVPLVAATAFQVLMERLEQA